MGMLRGTGKVLGKSLFGLQGTFGAYRPEASQGRSPQSRSGMATRLGTRPRHSRSSVAAADMGCYVAPPRDVTSAATENGAMAIGDGRGRFDLRRLWADDAPDIGLGPNDFLVAAAVSDIGRPAPVSEVAGTLAAELGSPMRTATLYGTVRKLRRLGLIARTGTLRSPAGGRPQAVLGLTERGTLALEVGAGIARSLASAPPSPKAAPSA